MQDIREILNSLEAYGLTDKEIMEIAGIKDKDTLTRWWGGTKPRPKSHGKLWIHLQSLAPVDETCPYGIPTREMYLHALELRLIGLYGKYPHIKSQMGHWRSFDQNKEIPDKDWNDAMILPVDKDRLFTKKNYYELGWTDTKPWHNPHYEINEKRKIRIVAEFHDDERIRKHFLRIFEQV
jgi:hypothetical protein